MEIAGKCITNIPEFISYDKKINRWFDQTYGYELRIIKKSGTSIETQNDELSLFFKNILDFQSDIMISIKFRIDNYVNTIVIKYSVCEEKYNVVFVFDEIKHCEQVFYMICEKVLSKYLFTIDIIEIYALLKLVNEQKLMHHCINSLLQNKNILNVEKYFTVKNVQITEKHIWNLYDEEIVKIINKRKNILLVMHNLGVISDLINVINEYYGYMYDSYNEMFNLVDQKRFKVFFTYI